MTNSPQLTGTFQQYLESLTSAQRDYFIATTDIFHDTPYDVIGRPSFSTQRVNTVVLNADKTISASTFGITSGTWNAHICSLPWITPVKLFPSCQYAYCVRNDARLSNIGGINMAGITVCVTQGDTETFSPAIGDDLTKAHYTTLDMGKLIYAQDPNNALATLPPFYEILSIGFEVINETPPLQVGGNQIRYRVPTQNRKSNIEYQHIKSDSSADPVFDCGNAKYSAFCIPMPPNSPTYASQFPTSVSAPAKEGTYSMHTLQDAVSDYYMAEGPNVLIRGNNFNNPSLVGPNTCWSTQPILGLGDIELPLIRGDFDMVGSYYTGLPLETILTIRYRVILSTVPNSNAGQLVSLSKLVPEPSLKLDKLIRHVQSMFPPGVPYGDNPKGEWFKKVLNFGKKALPKVIPIAQQVLSGNYVGALNDSVKLLEKKKQMADKKLTSHDNDLMQLKQEIERLKQMMAALTSNQSRSRNNVSKRVIRQRT